MGSVSSPELAATDTVCLPSARPVTVHGELQAVGAAPSSEQPKVAVASPEWKANCADELLATAAGVLSR